MRRRLLTLLPLTALTLNACQAEDGAERLMQFADQPELQAMASNPSVSVAYLGQAQIKDTAEDFAPGANYLAESDEPVDRGHFSAVLHAPDGGLYAIESTDAAFINMTERRYAEQVEMPALAEASKSLAAPMPGAKPVNIEEFPGGLSEQVFGDDDRVLWTWLTDYDPFSALVFISYWVPGDEPGIISGKGCSGTLIDDEYVITAAHCIYDDDDGWRPLNRRVCIGGEERWQTCANVEWQTVPSAWLNSESIVNDYGLLHLTAPIGANKKFVMSVGSGDSLKSIRHYNAGYPALRPITHEPNRSVRQQDGGYVVEADLYGMGGNPWKVSSRVLKTRFDVGKGQSGSPIFYLGGSSYAFQTGVMSKGRDFSGTSYDYNGGPLIAPIRSWFTTWMYGG